MFNIQCLNAISDKGLSQLPSSSYQFSDADPDAILLRSFNLHDMITTDKLKAVARAGAGTNNIPVDKLKALGIPVFNTPGANANAVKELVLAGLLLSSRNLCQAWQTTRQLQGADVATQVEALKKQFSGSELPAKTIGVVGLGAIGVQVANAAEALGMQVLAYDPHITIKNAWQLSATIKQCQTLDDMLPELDFLTVHVPYNDQTHHLINDVRLKKLKPQCTLLNFARGQIIDSAAVLNLLAGNQLKYYVTDFPDEALLNSEKVIGLPHLGASTAEAEENCAVMAATTLRNFLEQGNIQNSVNFPEANLGQPQGHRLTIANQNIPNMVGQISKVLAEANHNIIDMLNKSRDDIAYTILDVEAPITAALLQQINKIEGVLKARAISPL